MPSSEEPTPNLQHVAQPRTLAPEEVNVVLIGEAVLRRAEGYVEACEECAPNASVTFDYLLDAMTGCDPVTTEYLMLRPACCPCCGKAITEKTQILL